jgi:hypothetical protein
MEAYDLKALEIKLKEAGLPAVEFLAEKCYSAVKEWIKESAEVSATPYDNLVVPFIDQLDTLVLPVLNKIDGDSST